MICSVCTNPDAQLYTVGRVTANLCTECIEGAEGGVTRWMRDRTHQLACEERAEFRRERRLATRRGRLPAALRVIERDGYATPETFGVATKLKRQSAYHALRWLVRNGLLECDRFYGGEVRYFKADARRARVQHAEAAE